MEPSAGRGAMQRKQVRREAQHPPRLHAGQNHAPGVGWRGAPPEGPEHIRTVESRWSTEVGRRTCRKSLPREGEVPVTYRNIHLCTYLCESDPSTLTCTEDPPKDTTKTKKESSFSQFPPPCFPSSSTIWNFSPGPGRPRNSVQT